MSVLMNRPVCEATLISKENDDAKLSKELKHIAHDFKKVSEHARFKNAQTHKSVEEKWRKVDINVLRSYYRQLMYEL